MQIVEIKWVDAEHYTEPWPDDWEGEVGWVKTVGYLLKETSKTVTLAMSVQEENVFGGIFKIPKVAIIERKEYGEDRQTDKV